MSETKAWQAINYDCAQVIFAETRGRAKALALDCDAFEGSEYTDVRVLRLLAADKYIEDGKVGLDWSDLDDLRKIRKLGWFDEDYTQPRCKQCGLYECRIPEGALNTDGICKECAK